MPESPYLYQNRSVRFPGRFVFLEFIKYLPGPHLNLTIAIG
jgi:hypothetical protein